MKKTTNQLNTSSRSKVTPRPPVVAVLGHIDHGKTTLLDQIRHSNIAAKESGGITQHIGAYQIKLKTKNQELKTITFIDTPGHAAFSKMRSRGATVADLAVLVVAADEGFKPQTKESLEHIKSAGVPFLVAINKIDLPNISLEKVQRDLAANGVMVEKEGGDIVALPISAKTGQGVNELLEMILLLAEMAELKADPTSPLKAVVIESRLDQSSGPLATLLIREGTLRVGDEISLDNIEGKVKAMADENGQKVIAAAPGKPVIVLGFKSLPPVGGIVGLKSNSASISKAGFPVDKTVDVTNKGNQPEPEQPTERNLKIIIRADATGTLEAILGSLAKEVEIISSDIGDVTESDVLLADTTGAKIVGFKVRINGGVKKLAQMEKVDFKIYQTIYELLEQIETDVLRTIEPTIEQQILGQAEIIAEFEFDKQRVTGCRVTEGRIARSDKLYLRRGKEVIGNCRIKSMRKDKINIDLCQKGEEFGAILSPSLDFAIGDVLVSSRV